MDADRINEVIQPSFNARVTSAPLLSHAWNGASKDSVDACAVQRRLRSERQVVLTVLREVFAAICTEPTQ
jgi:hypothetical protein